MPPASRVVQLRDRLRDPGPGEQAVGLLLVGRAVARFREQRHGSNEWPPRRVPNVLGILSDLEQGRQVPQRRFEARPALVDQGHLRRNITHRVLGPGRIELHAATPYASTHERGGTVSKEVTRQAVRGLVDLLRARKDLRPKLGWLFHFARVGRKVESTIPARPFLRPTPKDLADAEVVFRRYVQGS